MFDKIKSLKEILKPDAIKLDIPIDEYIETYTEKEILVEFTKHVASSISGHVISSKDLSEVTFSTLKKYLNLKYNSTIDVNLYQAMITQFNNELNKSNSQSVKSWQDYNASEDFKISATKGGIISGNKYNGKFFEEWREENPDEAYESSKRGALTKCYNDMENGTGLFGMTKEERIAAGQTGNAAYWDNATPEEIRAKYDKASESMKEVIKEKGWWNPHEHITDELRLSMTANMKKTKKNNKVKKLEELHARISHYEWMTLDEAYDIVNSYRKASMSTVRRMMYSWEEAKALFETKYIPNPTGEGQNMVMIRKK